MVVEKRSHIVYLYICSSTFVWWQSFGLECQLEYNRIEYA